MGIKGDAEHVHPGKGSLTAMKVLPYGRQNIEEDDIAAVVETLRSDYLTTGPKIAEFEKSVCEATGAAEAIACSNATTALHLAALALDLEKGDCVIVPSLTFLATANAIRYAGIDVVFADVNPDTALMEGQHLEEALERCGSLIPRAVFPVHMAGQCVNLAEIRKIADKHNLAVVADAAHAIGAKFAGKPAGSCDYEDMSIFSFHSVKTVAMGEGGAITTNDPETAKRLRHLRSHGMIKKPEIGPWYYEMPEIGYNFRVTDIQCALGISQMAKLKKFVDRRKALVDRYDDLLKPLANVINPPARVPDCDPAWHLYQVRIDFDMIGMDRGTFMNRLHEKGVGTQVHYIPVHSQPYYTNLYGRQSLPGAQYFYEHTLSLPLYPSLKDEEVDYVVRTIRSVMEEGGRT